LIVVAVLFYGRTILSHQPAGPLMRVGLIQPNIPQQLKWVPELKNTIIEKIVAQIELISTERPQLIILPEAAYPGLLNWEFEGSAIQKISQRIDVPIIIGAPSYIDQQCFNSAVLVYGGKLLAMHHKLRLVPFGEFVPFRWFFQLWGLDKVAYSLGVGDFTPGKEFTLFSIKGMPLTCGVLVCFEDSMPAVARGFMRAGATMLVNITNDAWFGESSQPFQHVSASVLRAVENNCVVVRAANSGVSTFITPDGKTHSSIADAAGKKTFVSGAAVYPVQLAHEPTLYQKGGFLFPWVAIAIVLFGYLFSHLRVIPHDK